MTAITSPKWARFISVKDKHGRTRIFLNGAEIGPSLVNWTWKARTNEPVMLTLQLYAQPIEEATTEDLIRIAEALME